MIWICMILFSLLLGIFIGAFYMYRRDRNLLLNHRILNSELQNSKTKLNEYQNKLSSHFTANIELLNKIAENYQHLYQNITKSANFFLPNMYNRDNMYTVHTKNIFKADEEQLPIEVPRDYSDSTEILQKKNHDI